MIVGASSTTKGWMGLAPERIISRWNFSLGGFVSEGQKPPVNAIVAAVDQLQVEARRGAVVVLKSHVYFNVKNLFK